ncbi:MAG: tRNA (adenosine(37)-N6)-threonylcarbamoyltransferase complex ATPase subunit type 1 TsaE [Bacteroidetes bacterium]|nr:MAG: tRNA (adenosine(37)-N6)-threonylcarbamoyltransferase complex ATPase subunit type 1 TsaE [Bacteroidota bacterium]
MPNKKNMIVRLNELEETAKTIISKYANNRLFVLNGEMGAGKTTFAKYFCNLLGAEEEVTSPTFAIANIYTSSEYGEINHFDFYRLEHLQEAIDIGLDDYLYSGNYCLMEWADIIIDLIPKPYVKIDILHVDNIDERDLFVSLVEE